MLTPVDVAAAPLRLLFDQPYQSALNSELVWLLVRIIAGQELRTCIKSVHIHLCHARQRLQGRAGTYVHYNHHRDVKRVPTDVPTV